MTDVRHIPDTDRNNNLLSSNLSSYFHISDHDDNPGFITNSFHMSLNDDTFQQKYFGSTDRCFKLLNTDRPFHSPKKRKVDKDGFVTPATPEARKRSSTKDLEQSVVSEASGADCMQLTQYDNSQEDFPHTKTHQDLEKKELISQGGSQISPDRYEISQDNGETSKEEVQISYGGDTQELDPEEEKLTMREFLKEVAEQSREDVLKWTGLFEKSEEFEENCVIELDNMIKQAKALEMRLIKQKNELRDRLMQICRALQIP